MNEIEKYLYITDFFSYNTKHLGYILNTGVFGDPD